MNIRYAIKKIRHMPIREIRHRLNDLIIRFNEKRIYINSDKNYLGDFDDKIVSDCLFRFSEKMIPGVQFEEISKLRGSKPSYFKKLSENLKRKSEKVLDGKVSLLGRNSDLSEGIHWHCDHRENYIWPKQFYATIPIISKGQTIDVKWVWELNRHQFLVELAQGWAVTQESRYATRCRDLIINWIKSNPIYEGVNWASALEVAMRCISWIWIAAALSNWDGWRERERELMGRTIVEHGIYLEKHLSIFSSPYNHLIGESTALFMLGMMLKENLLIAEKWEKIGRNILNQHIEKQFYKDGFSIEQASGYHFFSLGFGLMAILCAERMGKPMKKVHSVLEKAFETGALFKQPDGFWPIIGDFDSARSIPVFPKEGRDFSGLCSAGAIYFKSCTLKGAAVRPGKELWWLFGTKGLDIWESIIKKDLPESVVLPDAGYAIISSGNGCQRDWLLFDAGPLADGVMYDNTPSVAHGHDDALQVLIHKAGRPLLVDSGIPYYSGKEEWIRYFRNASAHNTISVQGLPWVRNAGWLAWSNLEGKPILDANLSQNIGLMRGRLLLGGGMADIERVIFFIQGIGTWIVDSIICTSPRSVKWNWHFPKSAMMEPINSEMAQVFFRFDGNYLGIWSSENKLKHSLTNVSHCKPDGWLSNAYGVIDKGHHLSVSSIGIEKIITVTFIGAKVFPWSVSIRNNLFSQHKIPQTENYNRFAKLKTEASLYFLDNGNETIIATGQPSGSEGAKAKMIGGIGKWPAYILKSGKNEFKAKHELY